MWADFQLSNEDLQRLYSREYFEGSEYQDYEKERTALARNFRGRLAYLRSLYPKGSSLWEIGAAYGFFLAESKPHFQVAGCDISEYATDYARNKLGIQVSTGDYMEMTRGREVDEVICLWDTIEHLQQPQNYLQKAFDELKSGGTLGLSTGDIGSLVAKLRGDKWRLIHPPTHLHYFSVKSIKSLLSRLGFQNIRVEHPAFWRSADAVAFRLLAANKQRRLSCRLYQAMRSAHLLEFYFPLNTFDLMTVWAEKPRNRQ